MEISKSKILKSFLMYIFIYWIHSISFELNSFHDPTSIHSSLSSSMLDHKINLKSFTVSSNDHHMIVTIQYPDFYFYIACAASKTN